MVPPLIPDITLMKELTRIMTPSDVKLTHLSPEVAVIVSHREHSLPQGDAGGVTAA